MGADNRVQQMVFHHGGAAKPNLVVATWAGYKKAGPLAYLNGTPRYSGRQAVDISSFTNVAVKLTGSDTWVNAQ